MKPVNRTYNHKILFGFPTNKALKKDKKNFFLRVTVQVNSKKHPFFLITAFKKKSQTSMNNSNTLNEAVLNALWKTHFCSTSLNEKCNAY